MKINKANNRDRKRNKRSKMVVDSRSVFVMQDEKKKRDEKLKRQRRNKERLEDG